MPTDAHYEIEVISELKSTDKTSLYVLYDRICRRKLLMKSGDRAAIENEAAMLERFAGNGVPPVYGCRELDSKGFLFRRYIEGKSLREHIDNSGCFSAKRTAEIGSEVCKILSRLHSAEPPVIHRDIKTDNIVLTPNGEVYIIDFDIAREYDEAVERDTTVLGTPITAPPEQFGYTQTDERSDIYAVGVMLNEMLTGSVKVDTTVLPRGLSKIIARCTEFSPEKRYKNAMELEAVLSAFIRPKKMVYMAAAACAVLIAVLALTLPKIQRISDVRSVTDARSDADASGGVVDNTPETPVQPASFTEDGCYVFADKTIEAEVRRILGKDESANITKADLDSIGEIKLVGETHVESWGDIIIHGHDITVQFAPMEMFGSVAVLDDLANMPNLRTVILCNQRITDISPLANLSIRYLALHGNNISDVSALSDCTALERLYISSNPIEDFSPLVGLNRLSILNIGATDIKDLGDISKLSTLTRLEIHDCSQLEDMSALKELRNIVFLSLRPAPNDLLDIISEMTALDCLYIWHAYNITSLEPLSNFVNLRFLGLDACGISSLKGIESFPRLSYLTFRYCHVQDLSPLAGAETLEKIGITDNPATDYSVLGEMKQLTDLWCSQTQFDAISEVLGDTNNVLIQIE